MAHARGRPRTAALPWADAERGGPCQKHIREILYHTHVLWRRQQASHMAVVKLLTASVLCSSPAALPNEL